MAPKTPKTPSTDSLFARCLERLDGCLQEVLHAGSLTLPGKRDPEFQDVFDKACEYRNAKQTADNHREFDLLTEQEAVWEATSRDAFCKAYAAFLVKYPEIVAPN